MGNKVICIYIERSLSITRISALCLCLIRHELFALQSVNGLIATVWNYFFSFFLYFAAHAKDIVLKGSTLLSFLVIQFSID